MNQTFINLIKRYEERRAEFLDSIYTRNFWLIEFFRPSETPKVEQTIDQELKFYESIEKDISALQNLSGVKVSIAEWQEIAHSLKIHNERLSSQLDGMASITAFFALVSAIFLLLAKYVDSINWVPFALVTWVSVLNFGSRLNKRPELSRNKEILLILERYIEKNA